MHYVNGLNQKTLATEELYARRPQSACGFWLWALNNSKEQLYENKELREIGRALLLAGYLTTSNTLTFTQNSMLFNSVKDLLKSIEIPQEVNFTINWCQYGTGIQEMRPQLISIHLPRDRTRGNYTDNSQRTRPCPCTQ